MSVLSLGRAAADFIGYVQLFQSTPEGARPPAGTVRAQLVSLLDALAAHPDAREVPAEELDLARFALVAWADEILLRSKWSGHDEWRSEPLQLQLFRTNRAGDEFFDHLAGLRPDQTHARLVFYLCLASGFEGRYAGREPDRRALIDQQFEMLRVAGAARLPAEVRPISPPAYDLAIRLPSSGRGRLWTAYGLMGAGGLAVFAVLWVILRIAAGSVPLPPGS